MEKPKIIPSDLLGVKLIEAGILPPNCRRFVIDGLVGDPLRIYIECFGDEQVLEVVTPESLADAIKIRTIEKLPNGPDAT
jgi:hypothetical protein